MPRKTKVETEPEGAEEIETIEAQASVVREVHNWFITQPIMKST
jgi:hypothetical protein